VERRKNALAKEDNFMFKSLDFIMMAGGFD
jgi:hypothetical protein